MRVLPSKAAIAKCRGNVLEAGDHPVLVVLVPVDRGGFTDRVQGRVRIGDERWVVDIEACDETVEVGHGAIVGRQTAVSLLPER